jgi:Dolichyl-phosphate-mannose-protein mannosyltransferase
LREEKCWKSGMAGVLGIALGTVLVHLATGWRYGFDRDELMALEDARHLAWGYVQYPPMTAFFAWVSLKLFGTSLVGARLFVAVVQAVALVLTGLMAKELGGGKWAQVTATLAGVPFCLGGGALLSYISFDYVCWVLVEWGMVKLVTAEIGNSKSGIPGEEEGGIPFAAQGKQPALQRFAEEGWWWVVVGAGIGLGMLAKYTMGLLVTGVLVGVLATELRRWLKSGWLWAGVAVSLAIFLPNFLWEWSRGFVSLEFLRFLHARDVATGVTDGFFMGQFELAMLALPLAAAGLWFCMSDQRSAISDHKLRVGVASSEEIHWYNGLQVLGWMYLVPLVLLVLLRGRDYYLAPAYPMLYAAGALWVERKTGTREVKRQRSNDGERRRQGQRGDVAAIGDSAMGELSGSVEILRARKAPAQDDNARVGEHGGGTGAGTATKARWIRWGVVAALGLDVVAAGAVALPIAPVNSAWWKMAAQVVVVFPEEIGWEEFTESVAQVWNELPGTAKQRAGILAGNYGEIGALNLYGERWGLPRAISGVNSSWERGYGNPPPQTLVVVGYPREFLEAHFASCEVRGRVSNRYGVANEETIEDPDIFVCSGMKESWEEFWKTARKFA